MNFKVNDIIFCLYTNSIHELNKELLMKDIIKEMKNIGSKHIISTYAAMNLEMQILQSHWIWLNNPVISIKLK